jgi:hypothetical protein
MGKRTVGQESFAIMDNPVFLDLPWARLQCGQFGFVLEKQRVAGGAGVSTKGVSRLEVLPVPAIRLASTNISDILDVVPSRTLPRL